MISLNFCIEDVRNQPPFSVLSMNLRTDMNISGGDASPLADAIIDRIAHDSYRINITSIDADHDISMREVYGLDKNLRE